MRVRNAKYWTATALGLALALTIVPMAAAEGPETMAAMSVFAGEVAWQMNVPVERMALRVAGPNTDHEARFEGGSMAFSIFDAEGNVLPDGVYNWELREEFAPVNNNVRDAKNGRDLEQHDSQRRVEVAGREQSGTFRIHNGALVDSSLVEVRAPRDAKAD